MRSLLFLFMALVLPSPAQAKWLEASSRHFVVYSDDQEKNIRLFSEQLERFHAAMSGLLNFQNDVPSPSNRVTVYIVRSDAHVRSLAGDGQRFTYAFYQPRRGGSLAIVPRVTATTREDLDFSMIALLHEYAHHLTFMNANAAMPIWFIEGSAEFFASAQFLDDGSVSLGRPADHRYGELVYSRDVPLEELFNPDMKRRAKLREHDSFYGKSWLLYHYLTFESKRKGQMEAYLKAINMGVSSLEAAKSVFGDFRKLDSDMQDYLHKRTIMTVKMPAAALEPGPVTLRELPIGEAAMMPVRIRSKRGVDREQALALVPEARKIAAQYPSDPAVLAALAEAEVDSGNPDAAIAAADAALALDPKRVDAYVQKGYALFAKAREANEKAKAYQEARATFLALNKIENDNPIPLEEFFLSYVEQGVQPNENALAALRRASELAPFDLSLRFLVAQAAIRKDNRDEAIWNLKPIAYHPHAGPFGEMAQKLIDRLQAGATSADLIKDGKLIDVMSDGKKSETPPPSQ